MSKRVPSDDEKGRQGRTKRQRVDSEEEEQEQEPFDPTLLPTKTQINEAAKKQWGRKKKDFFKSGSAARYNLTSKTDIKPSTSQFVGSPSHRASLVERFGLTEEKEPVLISTMRAYYESRLDLNTYKLALKAYNEAQKQPSIPSGILPAIDLVLDLTDAAATTSSRTPRTDGRRSKAVLQQRRKAPPSSSDPNNNTNVPETPPPPPPQRKRKQRRRKQPSSPPLVLVPDDDNDDDDEALLPMPEFPEHDFMDVEGEEAAQSLHFMAHNTPISTQVLRDLAPTFSPPQQQFLLGELLNQSLQTRDFDFDYDDFGGGGGGGGGGSGGENSLSLGLGSQLRETYHLPPDHSPETNFTLAIELAAGGGKSPQHAADLPDSLRAFLHSGHAIVLGRGAFTPAAFYDWFRTLDYETLVALEDNSQQQQQAGISYTQADELEMALDSRIAMFEALFTGLFERDLTLTALQAMLKPCEPDLRAVNATSLLRGFLLAVSHNQSKALLSHDDVAHWLGLYAMELASGSSRELMLHTVQEAAGRLYNPALFYELCTALGTSLTMGKDRVDENELLRIFDGFFHQIPDTDNGHDTKAALRKALTEMARRKHASDQQQQQLPQLEEEEEKEVEEEEEEPGQAVVRSVFVDLVYALGRLAIRPGLWVSLDDDKHKEEADVFALSDQSLKRRREADITLALTALSHLTNNRWSELLPLAIQTLEFTVVHAVLEGGSMNSNSWQQYNPPITLAIVDKWFGFGLAQGGRYLHTLFASIPRVMMQPLAAILQLCNEDGVPLHPSVLPFLVSDVTFLDATFLTPDGWQGTLDTPVSTVFAAPSSSRSTADANDANADDDEDSDIPLRALVFEGATKTSYGNLKPFIAFLVEHVKYLLQPEDYWAIAAQVAHWRMHHDTHNVRKLATEEEDLAAQEALNTLLKNQDTTAHYKQRHLEPRIEASFDWVLTTPTVEPLPIVTVRSSGGKKSQPPTWTERVLGVEWKMFLFRNLEQVTAPDCILGFDDVRKQQRDNFRVKTSALDPNSALNLFPDKGILALKDLHFPLWYQRQGLGARVLTLLERAVTLRSSSNAEEDPVDFILMHFVHAPMYFTAMQRHGWQEYSPLRHELWNKSSATRFNIYDFYIVQVNGKGTKQERANASHLMWASPLVRYHQSLLQFQQLETLGPKATVSSSRERRPTHVMKKKKQQLETATPATRVALLLATSLNDIFSTVSSEALKTKPRKFYLEQRVEENQGKFGIGVGGQIELVQPNSLEQRVVINQFLPLAFDNEQQHRVFPAHFLFFAQLFVNLGHVWSRSLRFSGQDMAAFFSNTLGSDFDGVEEILKQLWRAHGSVAEQPWPVFSAVEEDDTNTTRNIYEWKPRPQKQFMEIQPPPDKDNEVAVQLNPEREGEKLERRKIPVFEDGST